MLEGHQSVNSTRVCVAGFWMSGGVLALTVFSTFQIFYYDYLLLFSLEEGGAFVKGSNRF